jgi:hypothetical protein
MNGDNQGCLSEVVIQYIDCPWDSIIDFKTDNADLSV